MINRTEFDGIIELTFRKYQKERKNIHRGFIKEEHIKLVADSLMLEELKNEELNEMWQAVDKYFDTLYCEIGEDGEIIGFKPYDEDTEFYRDTQSAWLEVVNEEARKRKAKGEVW